MPEHASVVEKMLAEYDDRLVLHESFARTCEGLIRQLLKSESLRVHSVTSRVKERQHLAEKISRTGKDYATLSDVTDVVGVRVITHFEDEVDRIAEVVQREFKVDPIRSIDKRRALDPDRFGYISLHFICSMRQDRAALAEYREFGGVSCETQIRSILQHAWAEIEHDLGYKVGAPIPAPIRRRFSRLAGLLEIGDSEFTLIRNDLAAYAEHVTEDIQERPSSVGLDDVSLKAFIASDPTSTYLAKEIAAHVGATLEDEPNFQFLAEIVKYTGITTIEELQTALDTRKEFILKQYKSRVEKGKYATLNPGIGIFHLFEVLLAEKGDVKELQKAFQKFNIGRGDYAQAAEQVFNAIQANR
jgi:ppGpp synthetase/RelA/SpoT-type nucleotidyltranferase